MVNIGKKLKAARQDKGMSQEELAQAIGITKSAVSRYEAGKREPSYDQLQRIAQALGVSIYELFDGSTVDQDGTVHIWPTPQNASGEPAQSKVVVHDEPIQKTKVEVHSATQEDIKALLDKLQNGGPTALSIKELETLKNTPISPTIVSLDVLRFLVELDTFEPPLQARIVAAMGKLNTEGQEKVAIYAEDLAGMPKYQAQEPPQDAVQSTPYNPGDKDITSVETLTKVPQKPPRISGIILEESPDSDEGYNIKGIIGPGLIKEPIPNKITAITMVCPICGASLHGDLATGKAFCAYCNRSFPLPKNAKSPRP